MTVLSPTIEWRAAVTPFGVLASIPFSGSGYNGAIPTGSTSTMVTARVYNNFAAVTSIADALNCVFAVYDDTTHQGLAVTAPTTGLYVQVKIIDYNGVTTGADTQFYGIGGSNKHPLPVNGGTLAGSGTGSGTATNYVTLNIQIVVPAKASQGGASQGLWFEYSSTA